MLELIARRDRLPRSASFSMHTAAWLHGIDVDPCSPIEVNLPRASETSHLAGVKLTRSDVTESELCEVRGLPATSPVRTIADLGRRLRFVDAVIVIDMALHRGLVRIDELHRWADGHPHYWGVGRLKRALLQAEPATESPMETRLRLLLDEHGLPRPEVQRTLFDHDGAFVARPDFYYPAQGLALEYDGGGHRDTMAEDNRRQNLMIEAGYRLLRFTAGDILKTPLAVASLVRRALGPYSIGSPN